MPKTIAIVLNTAWNIYNFRKGIVLDLVKQGHKVIAVAPEDEYVSSVKELGVEFVPLLHLSRKGVNPVKELLLTLELRNIYKKYAIDIALLYTIKPNIYGAIATKGLKTKTICTVTGLGYSFLSDGLVNKVVKLLYRYAFGHATTVLFQNEDDQNLFIEQKLVEATKTAVVNGSGINTTFFHPMHNKQIKNSEEVHFLFVGRLLYDKGIRELMEAYEILLKTNSSCHLTVVGKIDSENPSAVSSDEWNKWVSDHQDYVTYVGYTDDVRSFIAQMDVVVLPSYREGLPRVILEAMAMEKPVIVTDVAGCRATVVNQENGFLVEAKNANALYKAMQEMLVLHQDERQNMGIKSRTLALEKFDEKRIVAFYNELIYYK